MLSSSCKTQCGQLLRPLIAVEVGGESDLGLAECIMLFAKNTSAQLVRFGSFLAAVVGLSNNAAGSCVGVSVRILGVIGRLVDILNVVD